MQEPWLGTSNHLVAPRNYPLIRQLTTNNYDQSPTNTTHLSS